jgi:hypothetical protein
MNQALYTHMNNKRKKKGQWGSSEYNRKLNKKRDSIHKQNKFNKKGQIRKFHT